MKGTGEMARKIYPYSLDRKDAKIAEFPHQIAEWYLFGSGTKTNYGE